MHILPVIDLMGGCVVRGVGGKRDEYRPIVSRIAADARPTTVARAMVGLGLDEAYLADLDAIGGAEPAWATYGDLADCGLRLWIDAGLADLDRAKAMLRFAAQIGGVTGIVAALESLPDAGLFDSLLDTLGPGQLVFSLDLRRGRPINATPQWKGMTAEQIGRRVFQAGTTRMIVLDLDRVGRDRGVGTEDLCRRLKRTAPAARLFAGGGARHLIDISRLAKSGCDGVLVASALHDGQLGQAEIEAARSI